MSAISPHLIHTLSPSSSTPMSSSSNINSSNTSTSQSPLSRPEFSYVPPPEAYPDSQRKIGLRHRAGTIATLAEQTALRKLVRHASLRWVDGGAVYIDRATGSYWEVSPGHEWRRSLNWLLYLQSPANTDSRSLVHSSPTFENAATPKHHVSWKNA